MNVPDIFADLNHPTQNILMQLGTVERAHPLLVRLVSLPLSSMCSHSSLDQVASAALDIQSLVNEALTTHILTRVVDGEYGNSLTLFTTNYRDLPSVFVSPILSVWRHH